VAYYRVRTRNLRRRHWLEPGPRVVPAARHAALKCRPIYPTTPSIRLVRSGASGWSPLHAGAAPHVSSVSQVHGVAGGIAAGIGECRCLAAITLSAAPH